MTPILIGDCECPGTVSAASATRTRATSTIDRLPIEGLLRDQRCGSENSARFHSREASVSSWAGRTRDTPLTGDRTAGVSGEPDGSRVLPQEDVDRTFARDVLRAFIAQRAQVDVVQEML